jgi:hypothetical protein
MAGLARRHQVLAAVLDPFQRTGNLVGGQHDAHVLTHRDHLLAEPTTGIAHDDSDVLCRNAEQPRGERAQLVRGLRRRPHRQFARVCFPFGDQPAGLDRHGRVDLLVHMRGRDVRSRGEGLLVGRRSAHSAGDVVGIGLVNDDIGFGGQPNGRGEVGDGRQWFVVDIDELDRVLGDVARCRLPATACHASRTSGLRSEATNTAWTPGSASAAAVSMALTRALANGLRTKQACSMPGRVTSSTNVP